MLAIISERMTDFEVRLVSTLEEMQEALSVRRRVFIEEQRVPEEEEIDAHDADPATVKDCRHVVVRVDGKPVATGRLLLGEPDGLHIGRVAVLAEYRRRGIGRAVMHALHDVARFRNARTVVLAAQLHAIPFYERLGYVARGPVFLDAGIEHRWMEIDLRESRPSGSD
jgi:predicted GNAT family N-acyltransferase